MKLSLLDRFSRKSQISNFIKMRPAGAELFHEQRRTDMTKLMVSFSNSANAPKRWLSAAKAVLYQQTGGACGQPVPESVRKTRDSFQLT